MPDFVYSLTVLYKRENDDVMSRRVQQGTEEGVRRGHVMCNVKVCVVSCGIWWVTEKVCVVNCSGDLEVLKLLTTRVTQFCFCSAQYALNIPLILLCFFVVKCFLTSAFFGRSNCHSSMVFRRKHRLYEGAVHSFLWDKTR